MIRAQKEKVVEKLSKRIAGVDSVFLTDNTKMTVKVTESLRRQCRNAGISVIYTKNRLLKQAIKDTPLEVIGNYLIGPTAVLYCPQDPLSIAKLIQKFNKEFDKPAFKLALVGGQIYKSGDLKSLADAPTKEEMIARIIGSLLAPVTGIVSSIQAPMYDLIGTLDAITEKDK